MLRRRRDALLVFAVALVARLFVVAWACSRFPAAEDGHYYDTLARRLVEGQGYTWLWPDGAVTSAALYPVGYPAMLALAYALFGTSGGVAMTLNAVVGAGAAYGAYGIVDAPELARWRPLAAGLVVALHPALVPYTAAVMTEGVTAALLVLSAALAAKLRSGKPTWPWVAALGGAMGIAALVRPQSIVLAPVFGALALPAGAAARSRLSRALAVTAVALACVAPWTARNCMRMHRCAFVSVNGGWNLLIGAQTLTGSWEPVAVPQECAAVWDEAAKDTCFERVARREILAAPAAWLARGPGKLRATFGYFGAAPWYLHASNRSAFDEASQYWLGAVETVACRLLLLAALFGVGAKAGKRRLARKVVAGIGAAASVIALPGGTNFGWLGYLALAFAIALLGWRELGRAPIVVPGTAAVVFATALVHAAFFGAGRYGLVVAPFVAALPFASFAGRVATACNDVKRSPSSDLNEEGGLRDPRYGCTLPRSTPLG